MPRRRSIKTALLVAKQLDDTARRVGGRQPVLGARVKALDGHGGRAAKRRRRGLVVDQAELAARRKASKLIGDGGCAIGDRQPAQVPPAAIGSAVAGRIVGIDAHRRLRLAPLKRQGEVNVAGVIVV
jgi:hypothetical protein